MALFDNVTFYTTVNQISDLPQTHGEVAWVGRSNAGKSSAINTLTGRTKLAFVSKIPGRTQHINFFALTNGENGLGRYIVDMPGYGYAKVPQAIRKHWTHLLGHYLQNRENLIGLVMIMDSRHPFKPLDITMLDFFGARKRPIHILLSKADKLSYQQQQLTLNQARQILAIHAKTSVITMQLFSSLKKQGIDEIESVLTHWFEQTQGDSSERPKN